MKLILHPSVYLIARQAIDRNSLLSFFKNENMGYTATGVNTDAELIAELAGRICYMSFDKPRPGGNVAYLDHIKECKHGSTLEHSHFCFIITGISRSLSHELVRHRAGWGFSQLSQRYVDESVAEYVVPEEYRVAVKVAQNYNLHNYSTSIMTQIVQDPDLIGYSFEDLQQLHKIGTVWIKNIYDAHDGYKRLIALTSERLKNKGYTGTDLKKHIRQAARSVLPNATETKMFLSANARALRHFIEMRGHTSADKEMQKLANAVLEVCKKEAPNIFNDYFEDKEGINTPYRKV